jgi:hypothetical protein
MPPNPTFPQIIISDESRKEHYKLFSTSSFARGGGKKKVTYAYATKAKVPKKKNHRKKERTGKKAKEKKAIMTLVEKSRAGPSLPPT